MLFSVTLLFISQLWLKRLPRGHLDAVVARAIAWSLRSTVPVGSAVGALVVGAGVAGAASHSVLPQAAVNVTGENDSGVALR